MMRRSYWLFIAIFLIAGTSCQPNVEKEKEAILAVLKAESDAIIAGDKERLFELHVKDNLETRLEMGEYGFNTYKGWTEVGALLGDFMEGGTVGDDAVNIKENMVIKVTGKSAWLTCDNTWKYSNGGSAGYKNILVMFLEKIKGEWKISFSAYYSKPAP